MEKGLENALKKNNHPWTGGLEIIGGSLLIALAGKLFELQEGTLNNIFYYTKIVGGSLLLRNGLRRIDGIDKYYKKVIRDYLDSKGYASSNNKK